MLTTQRREQIDEFMGSIEKVNEYLDMLENTIVHVQRREDSGPAKAKAHKLIRDILEFVIESMNSNVRTLAGDLSTFGDAKQRAQDYWLQVEDNPEDAHRNVTMLPGAELVLEVEESHEYQLNNMTGGKVTAHLLDSDGQPVKNNKGE